MKIKSVSTGVWTVVAIAVAVVWAFPVYWMFNSSFLPNAVLQSTTPTFLPFGGSFDNFKNVFADGKFVAALGISLTVTLTTVAVALFVAFLGALAISRFKFKGRKSFILAMLLIQMLPAEGMFIAQYKMMSSVGLLNNVLGLTLLYTAAVIPFTIWMLRGFVAGVPAELEEAGMVDGLSRTAGVHAHHLPAVGPRAGGLRRVRVPAGLERIYSRPGGDDRGPDENAAAVAARLCAGLGHPRNRLGPGHGRLHDGCRAGDHLLHDRPIKDVLRPGRRGGQGVMNSMLNKPALPSTAQLRTLAAGTLMPGFTGTSMPAWIGTALDAGLGSVCIYGTNLSSPTQLPA